MEDYQNEKMLLTIAIAFSLGLGGVAVSFMTATPDLLACGGTRGMDKGSGSGEEGTESAFPRDVLSKNVLVG